MKRTALSILAAFTVVFPLPRGNGDRLDSLPNLQERQLLVLTNACRMAPVQYRDLYIGAFQVLLPANYPAVNPLYWSAALNRAARVHAVDMANNCGMQHNSCNGTAWNTRIRSYYAESQTIAENIATGNNTALATVRQWVLEVDPSRQTVPTDLSSGDGHRKNIMGAAYKEMGAGYAKGPQQYTYFWVQDFGGGAPDFKSPLVAGCHLLIETGKTTFFANYYDSIVAPEAITCVIDGQAYPMTLALGTASKGTYSLVQTRGTVCRRYFFTAIRSGVQFRYPENGVLVTAGEGSCTQEYIPAESLSVRISPAVVPEPLIRWTYLINHGIVVTGLPVEVSPIRVTVVDAAGQLVYRGERATHPERERQVLFVPLPGSVCRVLHIELRCRDERVFTRHLFPVP